MIRSTILCSLGFHRRAWTIEIMPLPPEVRRVHGIEMRRHRTMEADVQFCTECFKIFSLSWRSDANS